MNRTIGSTSLLTTLHALVDALCACSVFLLSPAMQGSSYLWLFITYNCMAFLTQPLVGIWLDNKDQRLWQLWLSVALLLGGACLCLLSVPSVVCAFLTVTLIGAGNSLFHVFAGKYVAHSTANDIRHLGIFVSSGALGLAIGTYFSSITSLGCIIALMMLLMLLCRRKSMIRKYPMTDDWRKRCRLNTGESSAVTHKEGLLCFLLLVVLFRSFLGSMKGEASALDMPYLAVISMLLAVVGKATGGFLARKAGVWHFLSISLLIAGACFLLGFYHGVFLLLMVLFINFTMPLTLHLANRIYPQRLGFAFGMLAAMLAPGVGLAMICSDVPLAHTLLYPLIATMMIEAVVLMCGFRERRWQVLAMSMLMNILTNIPLNLYAASCTHDMSITFIFILESAVVIVESLLFYIVTRDRRTAFLYGLTCNVASYLCGLTFQLFIL